MTGSPLLVSMVSLGLAISFGSLRWFHFGRFGGSARFGGFVLVVSVVSVFSFWSFRSFRFGRFTRFGHFGRFVSVVSFRSFRYVVLGFSTCSSRDVVVQFFPLVQFFLNWYRIY